MVFRGATSLEDLDNSITTSTLVSFLTWTRERVDIVQVEDQEGVSNSVGTTICESMRP